MVATLTNKFLLTPLREGRPGNRYPTLGVGRISTHAPAGGATWRPKEAQPLRHNFYSRPCGRGDEALYRRQGNSCTFLLTPLREGRQQFSTSPS